MTHFAQNELDSNALDSSSDTSTKQDSNLESTMLNKITAKASKTQTSNQIYQSDAGNISRETIESNPSGNGDITSLLRILPNVQYDNAQLKSTTPGEIDPADISISGGLYYQNNFQLDGFNMNNDLDPIGGSTSGTGGASQGMRSGSHSQGLNVDTSLLESIRVQDSNISAAYGGFTGGVVEATTRKPRADRWHGGISWQHTSNKMTQYFIYPTAESDFATSSNENYQPEFSKHLIRANLEGYITKNFGILGSFSTTRSSIPLMGYSDVFRNYGTDATSKRDQYRKSDNYFLKAHYNPIENLTLEANVGYMPQDNTYFSNITKDSFYRMKSGGVQSGFKATWDTKIGTWLNTLSYSRLESSRRSDKNYWLSWRYSADDKNWAASGANNNRYVSEGGLSNVDQLQHSLSYKSDMQFSSLNFWRMANRFRAGLELSYQHISRDIVDNYYYGSSAASQNYVGNLNGATCQGDIFGLSLCSSATTLNGWNGQYIKQLSVINAGTLKLSNFAYGLYLEDDIRFDFGFMGDINARVGLRFDGDNYMDKQTLAPRFSLNYITPWSKWERGKDFATTLLFGANRYYGRNLFSYRLYDSILAATTIYTRTDITSEWTSNNASANSSFKFNKMNVPYDDEIMAGFTQNIWLFGVVFKYIHREGKDEIMRVSRSAINGESLPGYATNYTTYTNDGSSSSDIFTLSIQNTKPFDLFVGFSKNYLLTIKNHALLAFDWTKTSRSYNPLSTDDAYLENEQILYNGVVMNYRDRPVENWARPYTLRLTTTHTFNIWRTKWLWNNFFRYRAGYERMVLLSRTNANYDPTFSGSQYGKMEFKGAFTWDMRIGFEYDVWRKNTLYVNLDIYNVLNAQNMSTLSLASGSVSTGIASSTAIPVYEIGRQFWIQVGYKF